MNANPFSGPQESLPLFVYRQITEARSADATARAWTGALVLMLLVLALFVIARLIGAPAVGRRQRRSDAARPSRTTARAMTTMPYAAPALATIAAPGHARGRATSAPGSATTWCSSAVDCRCRPGR